MKPYYEQNGLTIYHADSREVLPELARSSVDLVVTDPPYATAAATVTTGLARRTWGGNWGDMSLITLMAAQIIGQPFLAPGHQLYWFCDHLSYAALMPFVYGKYPLVQMIIWDKDVLGLGRCYRKQTELILYCRDRNAPTMASNRRDLIRLRPNYKQRQHPAAKPLALVQYLLAATEWSLALDPFMGSGTTLLGAQQLGRQAIGIEIEERYCEIAAQRLSRGPDPGETAPRWF